MSDVDVYEDFDELADFALTSSEPPPPGTVSLEQELLSLIAEPNNDSTLNKDDVAAWLLSEDAILTGQKLVAPILHPYPSPPSSGNDKYSISDSDSSDDEISEHSPPAKKSRHRSDEDEPAIASVVQVKKGSSKRRSDRRHRERSRERGDRREERVKHRDTRGQDHSRPRTDSRPRRPQDQRAIRNEHRPVTRDHRARTEHRGPIRHTPYVPQRNQSNQWNSKPRDARVVLSARAEDREHFEDKIKKLEQQIKESEQGARRLVREARNAKEDLQKFVKKNVREEDRPRHREEKVRPREETRRKEMHSSQSRSRQSSPSRSRQNSRQSRQSSRHGSESRSRQNSGKQCSRKEETVVREEEWVIKAPSKWDEQQLQGAGIIVTGFSSGTTRKELFTYFSDYGTVTDVQLSTGEERSQVACVIFKRQSEVDKVLGRQPKREKRRRTVQSPSKEEALEELDILTPPPANSFDMLLNALQQH